MTSDDQPQYDSADERSQAAEYACFRNPRDALRSQMVEQRRALRPAEIGQASSRIVAYLDIDPRVRAAARKGPVGTYWPVRGEPDVRLDGPNADSEFSAASDAAATALLDAPHGFSLPGRPGATPEMRAWTTTSELAVAWRTVRYPADEHAAIPAAHHGMILVPALAFDRGGNRLGNGAGWYDRLLADLDGIAPEARPLLVGVAHSFQLVDRLEAQPWDVPMDLIATPGGIIAPVGTPAVTMDDANAPGSEHCAP